MTDFDPYSYPLEPWWFLRPHTIHGLTHTRRVLIHAAALAETADLDHAQFEALVHAAAWHDIGRTHDGVEPEHGRQSVARVKDLNLAVNLTPDVLELVLFAIEWHSTDDELAVGATATDRADGSKPQAKNLDPRLTVLWTLKDADGLDRVRIHDLDVTRLRSDAARAREAEAWRLYGETGGAH